MAGRGSSKFASGSPFGKQQPQPFASPAYQPGDLQQGHDHGSRSNAGKLGGPWNPGQSKAGIGEGFAGLHGLAAQEQHSDRSGRGVAYDASDPRHVADSKSGLGRSGAMQNGGQGAGLGAHGAQAWGGGDGFHASGSRGGASGLDGGQAWHQGQGQQGGMHGGGDAGDDRFRATDSHGGGSGASRKRRGSRAGEGGTGEGGGRRGSGAVPVQGGAWEEQRGGGHAGAGAGEEHWQGGGGGAGARYGDGSGGGPGAGVGSSAAVAPAGGGAVGAGGPMDAAMGAGPQNGEVPYDNRVTWSDQHGYALVEVNYSEKLHYSADSIDESQMQRSSQCCVIS